MLPKSLKKKILGFYKSVHKDRKVRYMKILHLKVEK